MQCLNTPVDTDGDGSVDAIEIDADADGINDVIETGGDDANNDRIVDGFLDNDNKGIDDGIQAILLALIDSDGDNMLDVQDLDSDNDGVSDTIESGGTDTVGDGTADQPARLANLLPNEDNNGIPDFQEVVASISEPEIAAGTRGIRTGLDGSGCTIGRPRRGVDPLLPGLLNLSLLWLARRHRRIVTLLLPAIVVGSGCSFVSEQQAVFSNALSANQSDDQSNDTYDRFTRSVYAGAGLGLSRLEPDTSDVSGWDPNDRVNNGGQVNIGLDLMKQLSLELHSADLGSAGLSPTGRINYHINGASALIYAGGNRHRFMRRGLTSYGRLGVGSLHNSPVGPVPFEKINASHVLFGAGVEYMTRSGIGARAEVIAFDKDVRYGQLGLMYRFGKRKEPIQIVEATPEPEPVIAAAMAPLPAIEPVIEYVAPPPPAYAKPDQCAKFYGVLDGVYFHTDSATLTEKATIILNDVADTLTQCTSVPVTIAAHTDSVGTDQYNLDLSKRRAQSVAQYLDQRGVDRDRIVAEAFGESEPTDTNKTRQGRLNNRRVELFAR